ncbi:polysaccharide biosynthesis tyrosine autokinase [Nakamurella flava]|uniref:Polysaccharide biosynthesis tyrosine autokinase n=1 Tax=Nakamurella flava TaxID=2576308 RepID=A0A4U6QNP1_9ACTN|nr:polysaccharide biosynthesis tyrosine autokinase [Nakamurella flava]TKV61696.1 polysaccharide biosynthesis tyrosine autokinase [Nakamurella flava]
MPNDTAAELKAHSGALDMRAYGRAIRKSWWLVLLLAVLGLGAGVLITAKATPQYQSSITWFASTPTNGDGTPLQADQYAQRRVNSYVGLLTSEKLSDLVVEKNPALTRDQVQSSITASADLNTVLLSATVTASSPATSLAIATGVADTFGTMVQQLENRGTDNPTVVLNVVSGPTLNPVPVSPKKTLNYALGLVVGLAAGLALAILRTILDTTVRSPQALRELTGAPVLATIASDRGARRSPLIVDRSAQSGRAEAFRQLRTNLQFVDLQEPVRTLVVTSSLPDEGKSSTAANLAVAFAESGRRTLLVEADLRRPKVADYLELERAVGLTDVLLGGVDINDALQPWGNLPLTLLASGTIPPNPSELLGSPVMAELMASLSTSFEMVVIDTPPLVPVTDAAIAATLADGAILIVRYGRTSRADIAAAVRSLDAVGARNLGSVLTMVPPGGGASYGAARYNTYGAESPTRSKRLRLNRKGKRVEESNAERHAPLPSSFDRSSPPSADRPRGRRAAPSDDGEI